MKIIINVLAVSFFILPMTGLVFGSPQNAWLVTNAEPGFGASAGGLSSIAADGSLGVARFGGGVCHAGIFNAKKQRSKAAKKEFSLLHAVAALR